jgi:mismatch-specific thymine-DNA glycosylase
MDRLATDVRSSLFRICDFVSDEEKKGFIKLTSDYLREGLDIVFIGINPSMFAAYTGKYYDGPGNHFWQALHLSRLLPELMSAEDDHKLLDLGIGFTNIVARCQPYKTFYGRKLRFFILSKIVRPWQAFSARSLP